MRCLDPKPLAQPEVARHAGAELLAQVGRELRAPVDALVELNGLLLGTGLDDRQRAWARAARDSAATLLSLVDEMLDLAAIERGGLELEDADLDVRSLASGVVEQLDERAQAKGVTLGWTIDADVPRTLRGDSARLHQVLVALLEAVLGQTGRAALRGRVSVASMTDDAVGLRFSVSDADPSTADGRPRRTTSPAEGTAAAERWGAGLRLAIARRLVELMGGELDQGAGPERSSAARFTARFALAAAARPALDPDGLLGLRALVVDDSATVCMDMLAKLTHLGIAARSAADGATALARMREAAAHDEGFDVAIVDLKMPGMDGLELARRIGADAQLASVALVLHTGFAERCHTEEARAAGIAAYLLKPVRAAELAACLRRLVGRREPHASRAGAPRGEESPAMRPEDRSPSTPHPPLR